MVVKKFLPYKDYRNGIIKNIFPTNESTEISVNCTKHAQGYSFIYPTAFLDDKASYFHGTTDPAILELTFKKTIFLTHFAAQPSYLKNGSAWCYPKNFEVTGCRNESCAVLDSIENSERYSLMSFVLTPVQPCTLNKIIIKIGIDGRSQPVLKRFEIFGYTCDNTSECIWRNIKGICTCSKKRTLRLYLIVLCTIIVK